MQSGSWDMVDEIYRVFLGIFKRANIGIAGSPTGWALARTIF